MATIKKPKNALPCSVQLTTSTGLPNPIIQRFNSSLSSYTATINSNFVRNCELCTVDSTTELAGYVYDNGNKGVGARIIIPMLNRIIDNEAISSSGTYSAGASILVQGLVPASHNGIYTVDADFTGMTRREDFNGSTTGPVQNGTTVFVTGGTINNSTLWTLEAGILSTDNFTFQVGVDLIQLRPSCSPFVYDATSEGVYPPTGRDIWGKIRINQDTQKVYIQTEAGDPAWYGNSWTELTGASGTAGGDLSGTYPDPTVVQIQGVAVSSTNATAVSNLTGVNSGDQTITLTGNVTGSGTGSFATTIGAGVVTNSMLAGSIAAGKLVGTDIATVGTITSGTWNGTSISTSYTDAKLKTLTGTLNRVSVAGTSTDPTVDISASYVGQSSITTLGTIGTGTWNGSLITGTYGGTGVNNGSKTLTYLKNISFTSADDTGVYTLPTGTKTIPSTSTDISATGIVTKTNNVSFATSATTDTTNASNISSGTLGVGVGGTGQTTYTDGQLLIGNTTGNTLSKATLTAGSNITITNGHGSISIAATSGGSGTVNSGTAGHLAYYATSTTAVSDFLPPSFSAWQNAQTTLAANALTKIKFDTKNFDVGTYYDAATNYRYLPLVSGVYQVNAKVVMNLPTASTRYIISLEKNGSEFNRGTDVTLPSTTAPTALCLQLNCFVQLNGSTDYIELFVYNLHASNTYTIDNGSSSSSNFSAAWVGPSS
jgi:hypothetical protein